MAKRRWRRKSPQSSLGPIEESGFLEYYDRLGGEPRPRLCRRAEQWTVPPLNRTV